MKYGEKFTAEKEVVGIPAEEFENVIMTYLPVTKEELKEWAVYDEQSNMLSGNDWDVVIIHQHILACLYRK